MTIIKVHHPFDANLEIIPMIIELSQAQDTGRGISRGNRPSIQSIQPESNPDLLRSSPWALHVASYGQEGAIYQNIAPYQIRG